MVVHYDAGSKVVVLLSKREAARALGISCATLDRLVARGELPSVKVSEGRSGRRLFRPEALARWAAEKERLNDDDPPGSGSSVRTSPTDVGGRSDSD